MGVDRSETLAAVNDKLQQAVRARGWSAQTLADQLNQLAVRVGERGVRLDERTVRGWLRGRGGKPARPRPEYCRLLCLLFQRMPRDLGLPDPVPATTAGQLVAPEPPAVGVAQALELSRRATSTDLPEPELASHEQAVDRLCTATRACDTFLRRDTIVRAVELDAQLQGEWPNEAAARDFHEHVLAARRAIGM